MAISWKTESYGMLDRWREYTVSDIWGFNQVAGTGTTLTDQHAVLVQRERDMLARGLNTAYNKMWRELNYPISPQYIVDEEHRINTRFPLETQLVRLRNGYIQGMGIRATTEIESDAVIVFSEESNLGVDDVATITVTSSVAVGEIQVFFRVSDGAPSAAHKLWRIEPLEITVSGTTVTIKGHRALFTKYDGIWDSPFADPDFTDADRVQANTETAANFITAVDVYRVYTDDTAPATLLTDPYSTGDITATDMTEASAGVLVNDAKSGHVFIRPTTTPNTVVSYVKVSYLAGYPLDDLFRPENTLSEATLRLANATMAQKLTATGDGSYNVWQTDRDEVPLTQQLANNPFGLLRGHDEAWKVAMEYRLGQGSRV